MEAEAQVGATGKGELLPPPTPAVLEKYEAIGLRYQDETLPLDLDACRRGEPQLLARGVYNTVHAVTLRLQDGHLFEGVFKPLLSFHNDKASFKTGIPSRFPQTAMRSLAAAACAKLLGFALIPKTRLALLTLPKTRAEGDARTLGLLMERVPGMSSFQFRTYDPQVLAELTRLMTQLQLLDHLIAEADRHDGNILVHVVSRHGGPGLSKSSPRGRVQLHAIDTEQCFGERVQDSEVLEDMKRYGCHGVRLPPVVDREMADAVLGLGPDKLQAALGNFLTTSEIDAGCARLKRMQDHLRKLEANGKVIPATDWPSISLGEDLNSYNSYAARDLSDALQKRVMTQVKEILTGHPESPVQQRVLPALSALARSVGDTVSRVLHPWSPSPRVRRKYEQLNLPINEFTGLAFTRRQAVDPPCYFGGQEPRLFYKVQLRRANGSPCEALFHPLNAREDSPWAPVLGIDPGHPRTALRQLLVTACAEALDLDVIAKAQMALLKLSFDQNSNDSGTLGLALEPAPGGKAGEARDAWQTPDRPWADLARELVRLQLFDRVIGQARRTSDRYFVHIEPEGALKVTGIAHRLCFGQFLTDFENFGPVEGFKLETPLALPPVVDEDTARTFETFTVDKLETLLKDHLTPPEVKAAKQRLQAVHRHLGDLRNASGLRSASAWKDTALLKRLTPDNSYFGRDFAAVWRKACSGAG